MPVIASSFRPPWYLSNCHVQTILPVLGAVRPTPVFRRERLELLDRDFLDLDWLESGCGRLAILCSGLEGNSRDPGMLRLAGSFQSNGWDVLAWNYRGCSGELNRLRRSYHSGATEDLAAVVAHAGQRRIALVGFSIGGNLVLKFLGESPPPATVLAAAAVSAPIDLAATARALDGRLGNRIYLRRLIASLCAKVREKSAAMPDILSAEGLDRLHGFEHFDERYTAPTHGFLSAEDYWIKCSARQFLAGIRVPTLLVSAKDDPFLTPESFPFPEAQANPNLTLEVPDSGGHLGFLDSRGFWLGRRLPGYLSGFVP